MMLIQVDGGPSGSFSISSDGKTYGLSKVNRTSDGVRRQNLQRPDHHAQQQMQELVQGVEADQEIDRLVAGYDSPLNERNLAHIGNQDTSGHSLLSVPYVRTMLITAAVVGLAFFFGYRE